MTEANGAHVPGYRNVMEWIVEQKLNEIFDRQDCCHCQQCRDDIIAYALNRLPPKYVVTPRGEAYSKTYSLQQQHEADVIASLMLGVAMVREHPRH